MINWSPWIEFDKQLPPEDTMVLVVKEITCGIAHYSRGMMAWSKHTGWSESSPWKVIYWAYIPDAPIHPQNKKKDK